jgi:hypothetical protein
LKLREDSRWEGKGRRYGSIWMELTKETAVITWGYLYFSELSREHNEKRDLEKFGYQSEMSADGKV